MFFIIRLSMRLNDSNIWIFRKRMNTKYIFFVSYAIIVLLKLRPRYERFENKSANFFFSYVIIALEQFRFCFKHIENKLAKMLFFLIFTLSNVILAWFMQISRQTHRKQINKFFFLFVCYCTIHLHSSNSSKTNQQKCCFF